MHLLVSSKIAKTLLSQSFNLKFEICIGPTVIVIIENLSDLGLSAAEHVIRYWKTINVL